MAEATQQLVLALAERLPPAIALGLAAGLLGWLLGLARTSGALGVFGSVVLAFLTLTWPGAALAALSLAIAAIAGRTAHARTHGATRAPRKLGVGSVIALTAVAWPCAAAASASSRPGYWIAAACGALAAGLATWSAYVATTTSPGRPVSLYRLRTATAPGAGLNPVGIVVGISTAFALATTALRLHLLGPGDPVLVVLAAVLAMAAASAPSPRSGDPAIALRALAASAMGAGLAAGLVALIP